MEARISRDVLESYIDCPYKAYLKLIGQHGITSGYETWRLAIRREVDHTAIAKIHAIQHETQVVSGIVLTSSALKRGPHFVLQPTIEDDRVSLSVDGLKRVAGVSQLGPFHYIPMLFYEGARVRKEQRLLLELQALLLARYQGIAPRRAIIWHGSACQSTTVHLNPDRRQAKRILLEVQKLCQAESPPRLILNDHCQNRLGHAPTCG